MTVWRKVPVLLFLVAVLAATGPLSPAHAADSRLRVKLELDAGYRVDELQWSIAGNSAGTNPNILSELIWTDLQIFQLRHRGTLEKGNDHYDRMTGQFSWLIGFGQILAGDNQDSDYAGDNRTLEWSRSNNAADSGDVFDLALAFGLRFPLGQSTLIMPQLGYSYHQQNLEISAGNQTLSDQAIADAFLGPGEVVLPPIGPFFGLDSSYDAEWQGPWLGIRLDQRLGQTVLLNAALEYHWGDYTGEADWNLRSDFMHPLSFRHEGDANGLVLELGLEVPVAANLSLTLDGNYQNWQVDSGTDITFFTDGSVGITKLQEVTWESFAAMGGLSYRF